jgi:MFS family permease
LRQSLDTIGAFLGSLVAIALMAVSTNNFRLVFWLALIPAFLAVTLLTFGVRESKVKKAEISNRNPLQWQALRSLGKSYWILVAVALLFNLGNSSDAFLMLRARETGISDPLIPLTLVVINIAYSLSAYPVGILSDRLGRFGLLLGGFLLYALVYLGFAFVQAPWQVWVLLSLYGLHLGMTQGILLALVADKVPTNLRGTAFGFLNLAVGLALLPASLLAGKFWQVAGSGATFIAGSFFAIAAVLLLLTQREKYS